MSKRIKNIAIIPARGGSKRIPRKNVKHFLGKPIIAYSISAAIESGIFDEIMVSTDDLEISNISRKYGAKIPFMRSDNNANDHAVLIDVLFEVVERYKKQGIQIENICCILPTAPFVTPDRLIEAAELHKKESYLSVFPVLEFSYPIQRSLIKNKAGFIEMANPKFLNSRSQDLQPHFHDSGQFYFISVDALYKEKSLFTSKSGVVELSQLEVQDIDTINDWINAEVKYRILHDK